MRYIYRPSYNPWGCFPPLPSSSLLTGRPSTLPLNPQCDLSTSLSPSVRTFFHSDGCSSPALHALTLSTLCLSVLPPLLPPMEYTSCGTMPCDGIAGDNLVWDYDLQVNHLYNNGDMAWVLASTALVWLMVPGVGCVLSLSSRLPFPLDDRVRKSMATPISLSLFFRFFYSGLLRRKNALSMIWLSMICIAVVSFQWFFWGFSLTFSEGVKSSFIGNLGAFFPPSVFSRTHTSKFFNFSRYL